MGRPGAIAAASSAAIAATEAGADEAGSSGPNFDQDPSEAIEFVASTLARATA